ncbi:MAG: RDD family protein [Micrococcales bacterium]|nr:RDD family protein [Micrococcales bacterium]
MSTGIVTGEGVLLESEAASVFSRMLSGFIDYTTYAFGLFLALMAASSIDDAVNVSQRLMDATVVVVSVTMLVVVPITVETLTRGRSLGRLAAGLRTVRDDGGVVMLRQAMIRGLVAVVEIWSLLAIPALLASMLSARGKRLGDMVAGTYVARVRGGPRDRLVVLMPPQLASWATRADVARLPDPLALSVRQFLGRATMMHPASRTRLGTELTAQVQQYVRPLPPTGTHPEEFLTAVLAERREREGRTEWHRVERTRTESAGLARLPYGVPDAEG